VAHSLRVRFNVRYFMDWIGWDLVWKNGPVTNSEVTALVTSTNLSYIRRAWLVLGLVTTFIRSTLPVFLQAAQPSIPALVGAVSTGS